MHDKKITLTLALTLILLEKLTDLVSKSSDVEVQVKFINRTTRAAYLEVINQDGDRELKFALEGGQSYTTTTLEKTYWFATMNRETDEGKRLSIKEVCLTGGKGLWNIANQSLLKLKSNVELGHTG